VELRRLELRTSCMPYTLQPPPGVAWRGPVRRSPAASVAGRGLASPGACPPWLPTWLPEPVSAANLRSSGYPATPGQPPAPSPGIRAPTLAGNRADRAARWPGRDEADTDPGSLGQRPQATGTGGEDVVTVRARHTTMASQRPPRASSTPARLPWAITTTATRLAAQPPVRRRWRVIEIRQTGDCRNRHDRCRRRPPRLPTTGHV
jgi:hypothetical protein